MAVYDITTQTIDVESLKPSDILNCPYTGLEQSLELPAGKYILEVWGAASNYPDNNHGKGGYCKGTLELEDNKNLYIYVGEYPSEQESNYWIGGWNGGGSSHLGGYNDAGGGGGATDICLVRSDMTFDSAKRYIRSRESYLSRLIVAGGGGGGYWDDSGFNRLRSGGYCPAITTDQVEFVGGMLHPGSVTSNCVIGDFGYGATSNNSSEDYGPGGGGWYGGGSAGDECGGGGSSFIWCEELAEFVPNDWTLSTDYYLTEPEILYGNEEIIDPDGNTSIGNDGDGYARITVIEVVTWNNEITYVSEYSEQSMKKCGDILKNSHLPIQNDVIGHKFDAWYYEPTFETKAKVGDSVVGNLTLYAKWNNCNTHIITNNLKGIWCDNETTEINEGDDYIAYYDPLDRFDMYTPEVKILYGGDDISNIFDYSEHLIIIENVTKDIEINIAGAINLALPIMKLFDPNVTYKLTIKEPNAIYNTETYVGHSAEIILDRLFMQDEENEFIDDFILVFKGEGE